MRNLYLIWFVLFLTGCGSSDTSPVTRDVTEHTDLIFHYSVLKALDNGVLEGFLTVDELKKYGDLGIGTYNSLDGEMILLDHEVYRVYPDGQIVKPGDETLIPYTIVSFFEADDTLHMDGEIDYPSLIKHAEGMLPSKNLFYAFRISGNFEYMKCGGVAKQERPYDESLLEILADRPVYEAENIAGTLVGFWCPEYIGDINTVGFHLHFISDDHSLGGHLMEFRATSLKIEFDAKFQYKIVLPETEEFKQAHFRSEEVDY